MRTSRMLIILLVVTIELEASGKLVQQKGFYNHCQRSQKCNHYKQTRIFRSLLSHDAQNKNKTKLRRDDIVLKNRRENLFLSFFVPKPVFSEFCPDFSVLRISSTRAENALTRSREKLCCRNSFYNTPHF